MVYYALIIPHVLLTMAGYAGLIATNVWLLMLCRTGDGATVAKGVETWQRTTRVFGPLLGLGVLIGFANALVLGIPLASPWLIATYVLVVIVLAGHATLMVPFNLRASQIVASAGTVSTRPIVLAISLLTIGYICIASLMFIRS